MGPSPALQITISLLNDNWGYTIASLRLSLYQEGDLSLSTGPIQRQCPGGQAPVGAGGQVRVGRRDSAISSISYPPNRDQALAEIAGMPLMTLRALVARFIFQVMPEHYFAFTFIVSSKKLVGRKIMELLTSAHVPLTQSVVDLYELRKYAVE